MLDIEIAFTEIAEVTWNTSKVKPHKYLLMYNSAITPKPTEAGNSPPPPLNEWQK